MNRSKRENKTMRVLLTGATGFLGSFLLEELVAQGHEVTCLVRKSSDRRWIEGLKVRLVYGALSESPALEEAVRDAEVVYHLGGVTKAKNREGYFQANYQGTVNLLEACARRATKLKRFLFVSTLSAAGPSLDGKPVTERDETHPTTAYGQSKRLAELAVLEYQTRFPVTIVRPPVVYGPRDRNVLTFFRYVKRGVIPLLGRRRRLFSLIYASDLVEGLRLSAEQENASGQIYFMADPRPYSWEEVGHAIASALNVRARAVHFPEWILRRGAALLEDLAKLLGRDAVFINREKADDLLQPYWTCDPAKAQRELGFSPRVSMKEGVRRTAEWYVKEGWL